MSNWLIALIIVVLVAAAFVYFCSRRERHEDVVVGAASTRDYEQERQDSRMSGFHLGLPQAFPRPQSEPAAASP